MSYSDQRIAALQWAIRVCEAYMEECSDDEIERSIGAEHVRERLVGWLERWKADPE